MGRIKKQDINPVIISMTGIAMLIGMIFMPILGL